MTHKKCNFKGNFLLNESFKSGRKSAKKNPRQRRRLGLDEVCVNLYMCIATLNTMNAHQNKLASVKKTCGI